MAWTLITGGVRRLGAHISQAIAQAGNNVVIQYRHSQDEAVEVAKKCLAFGVKADVIQGDFSSIESIEDFTKRYLKRFPETKALVNNVGNYLIKSALNTSVDEWMRLFQTNLHAPFALIKALAPSLIKQQGNIINIGISGLYSNHVSTYSSAYQLSKLSLLALTRSLAKEMASCGVRVNMVSPGYLDIAVDLPEDLSKIPMKRAAECAEISRVIIFLMDPRSEYITGQNIEVAGGVGL